MFDLLTIRQNGFEVAVAMIHDEHDCVLIDCGAIGTYDILKDVLQQKGKSVQDITHILITHHDHDHIGNLHALTRDNPRIKVLTSAIEKAYIEGEKEAIRMTQAKELQPTLSLEGQQNGLRFMEMLSQIKPTKVTTVVEDKEILPVAGGIEVLATPGHLPGHVSYYAIKDDVMVVGDAMIIENGMLKLANPKYSLDLELAQVSMDRLLAHPHHKLVCYHGGFITNSKG